MTTRPPQSTSMQDVLTSLLAEPGEDSSGLSVGISIACARFASNGEKLRRIGKQLSRSPSRKRSANRPTSSTILPAS